MKRLVESLLNGIPPSPHEQRRYQVRDELRVLFHDVSIQLSLLYIYTNSPPFDFVWIENYVQNIFCSLDMIEEKFHLYAELRREVVGRDTDSDIEFIANGLKDCQLQLQLLSRRGIENLYEQLEERMERLQAYYENLKIELSSLTYTEVTNTFLHQVEEYLSQVVQERFKKIITLKDNSLSIFEKIQNISLAKVEAMKPIILFLSGKFQHLFNKPQELANEIYLQHIENHKISTLIKSLVVWKYLDRYEQELKSQLSMPEDWKGVKPSMRGRKATDCFFEGIDNDRIFQTMKAIHWDLYQMSIEEAARQSVKPAQTYLICFLLTLYKGQLDKVWGKITLYFSCLHNGCKFDFLPSLRTFQKWIKAYEEYHNGRSQVGASVQRKYRAWDKLIEKIHGYLQYYQIMPPQTIL